jgi:hypothetical protein
MLFFAMNELTPGLYANNFVPTPSNRQSSSGMVCGKVSALTDVRKIAQLHKRIKHAQQELNRKLRHFSKSHGSVDRLNPTMYRPSYVLQKKGTELAVKNNWKGLTGKRHSPSQHTKADSANLQMPQQSIVPCISIKEKNNSFKGMTPLANPQQASAASS